MIPPVSPRKQQRALKRAKRANRKGGGDRLARRAQAIIRLREQPPASTAKLVKLRLSREAELRLARRASRDLAGWSQREPWMPVGCDAVGQGSRGKAVRAVRSPAFRVLRKDGHKWVER